MQIAPRRFTLDSGLPGAGFPDDRASRLAARRRFVEIKLSFLEALDSVGDPELAWLRNQVRGAEEALDLWLLRAPMFVAIGAPEHKALRQSLRRGLEALFPDSQPASDFSPF